MPADGEFVNWDGRVVSFADGMWTHADSSDWEVAEEDILGVYPESGSTYIVVAKGHLIPPHVRDEMLAAPDPSKKEDGPAVRTAKQPAPKE